MMDKKLLPERDICTKYITPAVIGAGWDLHSQIREEVFFTKGRVIVRGKLHARGERKFADYVLYYKPIIALSWSLPSRTGLKSLFLVWSTKMFQSARN